MNIQQEHAERHRSIIAMARGVSREYERIKVPRERFVKSVSDYLSWVPQRMEEWRRGNPYSASLLLQGYKNPINHSNIYN